MKYSYRPMFTTSLHGAPLSSTVVPWLLVALSVYAVPPPPGTAMSRTVM